MIVACLGMKGGSGKTTLATNIAAGLARRPHEKVLLLDTDEQASSSRWNLERAEKRPRIETMRLPDARLLKEKFSELECKFTHIIVDGSPRMDHLSTVTLGIADIVLIPIQPSPMDIWATEQLADRVHKVREINPHFQVSFVLNRFNPNTIISKSALSALETLEIPIIKPYLKQRVAYAVAMAMGLSVIEYSDRKAAQEISELLSSIDDMERQIVPFMMVPDKETLNH